MSFELMLSSSGVALLVTLVALSSPQPVEAAWPVLNQKEVQHFVDTFPGMYREYRKLGLQINPQKGRVDGAWKVKRNEEVKRILEENGWDFMFWPRLQAIVRGYSLAKYDLAVSEHGANLDKFVADLKKSQWMTPEKKAELEAFYSQLKSNFAAEAKKLRRQVHAKDLKFVKSSMPELDSVMQEVAKIEWEHALAKLGTQKKSK